MREIEKCPHVSEASYLSLLLPASSLCLSPSLVPALTPLIKAD